MFRRIVPFFASAALAVFACAPLMASDPTTPAKNDAKKSGASQGKPGPQAQVAQAADETQQGFGAFWKIMPLGQKNLDVKMPSFKDGKPASFVHAGSMTRIDDDLLEMEKVDIRLYGVTQADDLRVQLITGNYHMNSQVLDSHQRSRVSRSDFQLEGDRMVFDTRSQQGKMEGHVHMIIFDANSLKNKPLVNKAPEEETPQPAPKKVKK